MRSFCIVLAVLCAARLATRTVGEEKAIEPGAPAEQAVVTADSPAPAPAPENVPAAGSYKSEVGKKLKRAVTNVLRAPTEVYVQPMEAKRVSGERLSMLWPGVGEACGMFLTRLFGGIIEGATCVVPFPNGWQPLLDE